jgi:hypothetical protein
MIERLVYDVLETYYTLTEESSKLQLKFFILDNKTYLVIYL